MKTKIAVVVAFVAVAIGGVTTPSWAFKPVQTSTITAGVVTGGAKTAAFTLKIKDVSNPFGSDRSSVTWSNVNPFTTGWKIADRLLVLNSTVTDSKGGIKIYTDNTASDASPKFVDPTPEILDNPDSVASALLLGTSGNTDVNLAMAWSIKSSTKVVESGTALTGIGASDPNAGPINGRDNKFQWLFITDKYNWANGIDFNGNGNVTDPGDSAPLALDAPYTTMVFNDGLHFGQDNSEVESVLDGKDAYVYLQGNFAGAAAQQAYQTTALRIEAFIE